MRCSLALVFVNYKSDQIEEFIMNLCMIIGLVFSIIGTILTGFIASNGIPRKGEQIKAPKCKTSYVGRGLILLGFILQIISTVLS